MSRLPRNTCRHLEGSLLMHREVGIWTMWVNVCALCGELLSLGASDETPVAVEVRAAEIAGRGLGGHLASHTDESHCHHWWDGDAPCCRCGDNGNEETICEVGYLARCIVEHDAALRGAAADCEGGK